MATFFELGLESQLENKNQLVKMNKLLLRSRNSIHLGTYF